jgi:hypothetical protein
MTLVQVQSLEELGVHDVHRAALVDQNSTDVEVGHVGSHEERNVVIRGSTRKLLAIESNGST